MTARKLATKRTPHRTPTVTAARALGMKFGRAAVKVERRPEFATANRTRSALNYAVEELAFWELGESGHAASWNIQHDARLQRAFYLGARDAVREALAERPAARTRNPSSGPLSASEGRALLRGELREWRDARDDMPVGLWTPIAKAAKVSASEMRGVSDVASTAAYNARHGQARPRAALEARRELGDVLLAQVDAATDAQVLAYLRARSRFIER